MGLLDFFGITSVIYDYLEVFLGVVLALLAGLDGCGDAGAGIDVGVCLDELLLDISITSGDDDEFIVSGGDEFIVSGVDECTLMTSGLFCCCSSFVV